VFGLPNDDLIFPLPLSQLVAISFEGSHSEATSRVLDALKTHGVSASFFLDSSSMVEDRGDQLNLIGEILEQGHDIGLLISGLTKDTVLIQIFV